MCISFLKDDDNKEKVRKSPTLAHQVCREPNLDSLLLCHLLLLTHPKITLLVSSAIDDKEK